MDEQFIPGGMSGPGPALRRLIDTQLSAAAGTGDLAEKISGRSEVFCRVDPFERRITEVASVATPHRGYEALLPGRELGQVGRMSALASGLCGGVHATASALCLEMALGIAPPPLGIVLRNLLLSCQYFNDNVMHLFVLAGPDFSRSVVERTSPRLWDRARQTSARGQRQHGCRTVGDILEGLNKGEGSFYREALRMAGLARQAYSLLGGKYPHSESIVPGGVTLSVDETTLLAFRDAIAPFAAYSVKAALIWDDVFDFFLEAEPGYFDLGRGAATLMDFGQWDDPEHYNAAYVDCDDWGSRRWSSPGIVIDGQFVCGSLSELNAGLEEGTAHSLQAVDRADGADRVFADARGNKLGANHPWNRRVGKVGSAVPVGAYSWGSSLTWRQQGFEVGAYARLYLTAAAGRRVGKYFATTGHGIEFAYPGSEGEMLLQWNIPEVWNAFERNRARANVLAFNVAVTAENLELALGYVRGGETSCRTEGGEMPSGRRLGVGLWGASRGFLAHWAVIDEGRVDTYRISIPSRVNIGTRTDAGAPGPLEAALLGSPLIATEGGRDGMSYIDIQRAIQSFDPCMRCVAHILPDGQGSAIEREIDTAFPV
ncbi:nickel-dependent hydrogenase large subunit [Kordiimonas sp.]|uniref:nickel-dependent hydrogenase large subunit n=1 Tax=Kordiimonas sp. TaxID=1970157 RepID=UPI003A95B8A3